MDTENTDNSKALEVKDTPRVKKLSGEEKKKILYHHPDTEKGSFGKYTIWRVNENYITTLDIFELIKKHHNGEIIKESSEMSDSDGPISSSTCSEVLQNQPHYNVMFSGGWDSTALIIEHLEKGDVVFPFTVNFNPSIIPIAKFIIYILRRVYGEHKLAPLQTLFGPVTCDASTTETNFCQQSFTAFYSSFIAGSFMKNAIATEIAFCQNDDAISYLDELKTLYRTNLGMRYYNKYHTFKEPPLEFPFTKNEHSHNVQTVLKFENKYRVKLPVFGFEAPIFSAFKTEKESWIMIANLEDNKDKLSDRCWKPNKGLPNINMRENYIIKIDYKHSEKDEIEDFIASEKASIIEEDKEI